MAGWTDESVLCRRNLIACVDMPRPDLSFKPLDDLFKQLGSDSAEDREAAEHEIERRLCFENRAVTGDGSRPVKDAVSLAVNLASELAEDPDADQKDKDHLQQLRRILNAGCCTWELFVVSVKPDNIKGLGKDKTIKFTFSPSNKATSASRELAVHNDATKQLQPPLGIYNSWQQRNIHVCGDEVIVRIHIEVEGYGGDTLELTFPCVDGGKKRLEKTFYTDADHEPGILRSFLVEFEADSKCNQV